MYNKDTIAVFERTANEFVSGRINGDIVTFYPPKADYVDNLISAGDLIRLNPV